MKFQTDGSRETIINVVMTTLVQSVASASSTLHLLGSFSDAYTGAEREMLDLQAMLGVRRPVKVWSDGSLHRAYLGRGITVLAPFAQQFPHDGVLLIAGVHVRLSVWLKYAKLERIILFCNLANHQLLFVRIQEIREFTGLEPELVFVSHMLQSSVGLPGRVARSLMHLQPFSDVAAKRFSAQIDACNDSKNDRVLTVGRLSRDAVDKHHPQDAILYRMLASVGIRIRIMGGLCLAPDLDGMAGIELLGAGAETAPSFLASLDVFFYRTGQSTEAYGRVVLEAMASGAVVVAQNRGGYVEAITHGVNGFLIDTQEQAYDTIIALLKSSRNLVETAQNAVSQAQRLHGSLAIEQELMFYLEGTRTSHSPRTLKDSSA